MLRASVLLLVGSYAAMSLAEVPDEWLTSPAAELFGVPPTLGHPLLSPRGTHLVFLTQGDKGVSVLRALNLADGTITTLLQGSETGHDILWCDFSAETRLLCDMREGIPGRAQEYQKFYALNLDGSDLQEFARGTGCPVNNPWTNKANFDRLPDDSGDILYICNTGGRPEATILSTTSRRRSDASGAGEVGQMQRLYSNGHGLGSLYSGRTDDEVRWFYRDEPSAAAWQQFTAQDRINWGNPFRPVGFGPRLDQAFNIGWDPETSTWSLYRQNLTEPFENRRVYSHGDVDLEVVDTMGRFDRVVSVAFLDGRAQRAIVDRRVGEVYQFVDNLLSQQSDVAINIEIVDESWDQSIYLVKLRAPRSAGEFLLVNMETQQVQALGPEYDHLTGFALAETQIVQYEGSDGGMVTAHLTLPQTYSGPVPAVVIPRARPSREEVADPNYLVEFLAASGYAVLRVQNRVDAERGRGWTQERAAVGWEQTADDVSDGARFLIDNNITEAGKVCAIGKDYGAYSAFVTALKYPETFECIASIAAVTDPRLTPGADIMRRNVSGPSEDALNQASPVYRAAEIAPSVLMFHGENDWDFTMADHTVTLFNELERDGKDVQFIEYPYGNHEIRRAPYRIDMLARIGQFLAQHIGAGTSYLDALAETEPDQDAGRQGFRPPSR
jgi:dienelactone hydrolase